MMRMGEVDVRSSPSYPKVNELILTLFSFNWLVSTLI